MAADQPTLTEAAQRALRHLAGVDYALPSEIGQAMGGTKSGKAQGLGRLGGAMAARLVKAGWAIDRSRLRQGFSAYGITAAGRRVLATCEGNDNAV